VASVISPESPVEVPEIFKLHERDAVTITGTDYVVDGRIDVQAGPESLRLFRIDGSQKLWLLAPATQFAAPALVTEVQTAEHTNLGSTASKGTGSAIVEGRKVEGRPVSFAVQHNEGVVTVSIDWSGETQRFEGKEIAFDDVEVYPAVESPNR
jgi:hypothetical protein